MYYRNYVNPFFAQLGIGLVIKNQENFEGTYLRTIDALKKKYGLNTSRLIFTSRFLTEIMANEESKKTSLLSDFFAKMNSEIERAYVVHTIIPQTNVSTVTWYNGTAQ